MRNLIFFFLLIPFFANAQNEPGVFREYNPLTKKHGEEHKNVPMVKTKEILVVHGDSLYFFLHSDSLSKKLDTYQRLNKGMDIINKPDSVEKFLRNRIKAIMIIKDPPDKSK